jgi:hypothetical protein
MARRAEGQRSKGESYDAVATPQAKARRNLEVDLA